MTELVGISLQLPLERQVMWNGAPLPKFKPVNGIRKGCPLSSYLFVLCMEWLGHLIQSAIAQGLMRGRPTFFF
ncbi:hypothetical protein V6Z11_A03G183000 [Gossypium hirsutum]